MENVNDKRKGENDLLVVMEESRLKEIEREEVKVNVKKEIKGILIKK